MLNKKNNEIDMTNGPLLKKMLVFALPLIFTVVLQSLFNTADLVVVGKFGHPGALAAVGATGSAVTLFINFFVGLSVGASVCVSRFYGAKDDDSVQKCVHTSLVVALVVGVGVGLAGVFLSKPLLSFMETPPDIINQSTLYMQIYFMGMPFSMMYNFCASILRAVGDSKRCLIYISTAGIINVVLNLVFVIVFDMNVAGVATATVISQGYSAFMALRYLLKYDGVLKVYPKKLKIYKRPLAQILSVGVPSGLQSLLFSISNVFLQAGINTLGTAVLSGGTAASNVENYVYISQNSVANTVLNFTGQNFGANKFDRIKKVVFCGMFLSTAIGLTLALIFYGFSDFFLSFYTNIPEEIAFGKTKLLVIGVPYFLCGIMECLSSAIRGMCHNIAATIITVFGVCVARIVWIYTVFASIGTDWSLYLSYPVTWVLTAIGLAIMFAVDIKKEQRKLLENTNTPGIKV